MSIYLNISKKISCTLTALLVTFCVFSNPLDKIDQDASFFIQDGTKSINLQTIYHTPLEVPALGVIYVTGKTVFHAGRITTVRVVYLYSTKTLVEQETWLTGRTIIKTQEVKNRVHKAVPWDNHIPFRRVTSIFYHPAMGTSITNPAPSKKTILAYKKHTSHKLLPVHRAYNYYKGISSTYNYNTGHNNTPALSSYSSLPPPFTVGSKE
jgi:hypothetical protein